MKILILSSLAALVAASSVHAIVIYQDSFDRIGDLDGSEPDQRPGSETWSVSLGGSSFAATTDGSLLNVDSNGPPNRNLAATLPFDADTLSPSTPFFVEATMDGTAGNDWLFIGFQNIATEGIGNLRAWALLRDNGAMNAFPSSTNGGFYNDTPAGAGLITVRMTVDPTVVGDPAITLSVNGSDVANSTITASQFNDINFVSIGSRNHEGTFEDFSVQIIPEPMNFGLVAGALSLLVLRRRR